MTSKANNGPSKRKHDAPASTTTDTQQKRNKSTIIDDPTVISLFKELKMTTQFIHSGDLLAWALQPTDPDFINIHDYVERGQQHGYGIKIISIIRIIAAASKLESDDEDISFNDNPETAGQRRMMLWHGTKKHFLTNILENGLRMPKHGGQMFGQGIYFADRVSKSCNYTDHGNNGSAGSGSFLLLCDVILGKSYNAYNAIYNISSAPKTKGGVQTQSVMGLGRRIPDPSWNMTIDGSIWPMGRTIDRGDRKAGLQFNEYIVYDTAQVMPKYLVKVQITQAPVTQVLY